MVLTFYDSCWADQSAPLLRLGGPAFEVGSHARVLIGSLHAAALWVRATFSKGSLVPRLEAALTAITVHPTPLLVERSLQTVALAAVSLHAAVNVKEPAKRQQLSNVLAALNIGSTWPYTALDHCTTLGLASSRWC